MAAIPSALIAEARKRWNKCSEAEDDQRRRILAAKKFRSGEQWDPTIKSIREKSVNGQPPRPCFVVDRLSQPVRQTSNTIKNASFGFDVLPNGGGADSDTAEIFKGYLRRVHNQARGESPVEWAADGAIEGGLGWFRLRTEYVHETWDGDPNDPEVLDQEIRMERITNNLTVYCDPSAMRPTRSDALYMFIVEDMDKDDFKARYPKADVRGLEEFESTGDMIGWITKQSIRIAEYWRIIFTDRTFYKRTDGTITETKPDDKKQIETQRTMRVPTVKCDKINAIESLEQYKWAGSRIPIIPILGEELNVDGQPVLRGIIAEGMDAQRMVNYTYSGAIEMYSLASKAGYIAAAGQIDPYKDIWATANLYNYSYLPYEPMAVGGELLPPPQLITRDASGLQASIELMRTSEEAIKATTSTGDASLGNSHPNERSGRALQALQAASDLSNSNYPDNVRRALIYAAELMMDVIPKITRKGQILQIIGKDDEPEQVMVGQPFKKGSNGVPQAAGPDITPEMARLEGSLHQFYDLNNGRYAVTVSVGKATATKREEGAAALGDLIPHLPPPMAAVLTPEYIEQLSVPNAHKMAEIARKALPPELQSQEDGQPAPIPPQVQAQMQAMQQQLQQAMQFIQTKQAEQQGQVQQAQIKADADVKSEQIKSSTQIQLKHIDNAAKIAVARIAAAKSLMDIQAEAAEERLATGIEQQHEVGLTAMEQQHEREMAAHQAAVGQAQQGAQQTHEQQMAQQAAEQAAQQPNGGGA